MSSRLVPEIRFKEFNEEWEEKKLKEIYTFYSTNSFSRDNLNYKSGLVKNIHYGDIHTKFSTLFDIKKEEVPFINEDIDLSRVKKENYCLEGDLIFADASEDLDDVGKSIELINLNNEKLLSGMHTLLARQREKKFIKGFAGYLFKSNYIREQIKKEAQGVKVLGISAKRLNDIFLIFPEDEKEQQKIADILSSLDNLIEAQNKKVELLKEYKKGLMQKLFPQDGAKVPEIRFKEFNEEWEEKKLGDIGNIITGTTPSTKKNEYYNNGIYPWVTPTDIVENKNIIYTNKYLTQKGLDAGRLIPKNSLLVTCIASIGKNAILREDGSCNQQINSITPYNSYNVDFIYYLIEEKNYILKENAGQGGMAMLNKNDFCNLKFYFPPDKEKKEQQKIADTLSSLDNLIEAQNKKVELLKSHKKGLMQKMFIGKD